MSTLNKQDLKGIVRDTVQLIGNVNNSGKLVGGITTTNELKGDIHVSSSIKVEADYYEGEYIVTPTKDTQILAVKDKTMRHDLTINGVPYEETIYEEIDNEFGGITVVIGGM